jgi:hypothetical protein
VIPVPSLARLAARAPGPAVGERCDLCTLPLEPAHPHVLELATRTVSCVCRAGAVLFRHAEAHARFRTVPDRIRAEPAFALSRDRWAAIGVPVGLAFYVRDDDGAARISYPGPAGVVDGELDAEAWQEIAAATPLVADLEPEVEALLLRAVPGAERLWCHLVPITAAYELVALLRQSWRGFTGGPDADRALDDFFSDLTRRGAPR